MPINTQGVEYTLTRENLISAYNSIRSPRSTQRPLIVNPNTFNDLVGFYEIMTGNKYPLKTDPVQLHFEFYNELHHKPKKKKPMREFLCPF
jgi:hypothetical protein